MMIDENYPHFLMTITSFLIHLTMDSHPIHEFHFYTVRHLKWEIPIVGSSCKSWVVGVDETPLIERFVRLRYSGLSL